MVLAWATLCATACSQGAHAAVLCAADTVANDSTFANTAQAPVLADVIGQVFYTADTLLTSITVWRPTTDVTPFGMHLFLFSADSNGQPDTDDLILNGPTLIIPGPAAPGHLLTVQYVFDSPVILPHPGQYAMAFKPASCYIGQPWWIMIDTNNHYPDGWFWESERSDFYPDCPIYSPTRTYYVDLCFRATFCKDAVTAARRQTWGALKLLYR